MADVHPLDALHREHDLARLRVQAIDREVERLLGERDGVVGKVAVYEHLIQAIEGAETTPDVARRALSIARSRLDGRD